MTRGCRIFLTTYIHADIRHLRIYIDESAIYSTLTLGLIFRLCAQSICTLIKSASASYR